MDLSHIPMRGFPQPNPLLTPDFRREAIGRWLSLAGLSVAGLFGISVAAIVAFIAAPRNLTAHTPREALMVAVICLMGAPIAAPILMLAARKVNQTCSTIVVPGRLTAPPGDTAGCLWRCLVLLVTLPLSLPLAIAWGAYTRGFIDVGVEYVDRYGLKVAPLRVPKSRLNMVQTGQVVWFVPRAWNRAPNLWSEYHGHGSPYCLVNAQVYEWFERASGRAAATEHRALQRMVRAKTLRRLRDKKGQYRKH